MTDETDPANGLAIVLSDPERQALYLDFQPLVRRLIRQYGSTHEQRQDLHGEVFCRFNALIDLYDPSRGVPLRAYLVRKLVSSVYTYARSQWRRQRHEVNVDFRTESTSLSRFATDPIDPTHDWSETLSRKELLADIRDAIVALPQRQRQVVIWRYFENRSFTEIAEMLAVRETTARSLLRHGINNLRRSLRRSRNVAA